MRRAGRAAWRDRVRNLVTVTCILLASVASAQTTDLEVEQAALDHALVSKDTAMLGRLLHPSLSYGHSNGWVETKDELVKGVATGKMVYRKIESTGIESRSSETWVIARSVTGIEFSLDGKDGNLKLHVLQVWVKTPDGWQLLARQSTKL